MSEAEKIFIVGAGGNTRVLLDAILRAEQFDVEFIADDNPNLSGSEMYGIPICPMKNAFLATNNGVDGVVSIGDNCTRSRIMSELTDRGCHFINIIHPAAVIAKNVSLDCGCMVMAGAVVNPATKIGRGVLLNTRCGVDHDCVLEDFSHIAPGATLCGGITIGTGAFIGAGATVLPGVKIGEWSIVGAGATVTADVPNGTTVVGVPARPINREKQQNQLE